MKIKKVFENIDDDICREISYEEYAEYCENAEDNEEYGKLSSSDIKVIKQQRDKILNRYEETTNYSYQILCDVTERQIDSFFQFEVYALEDYLYVTLMSLENTYKYYLCEREGLKNIADKFLKEYEN
jgi:hypothetical protein